MCNAAAMEAGMLKAALKRDLSGLALPQPRTVKGTMVRSLAEKAYVKLLAVSLSHARLNVPFAAHIAILGEFNRLIRGSCTSAAVAGCVRDCPTDTADMEVSAALHKAPPIIPHPADSLTTGHALSGLSTPR